jgi:uncharacterized protein (DUF1778 family)
MKARRRQKAISVRLAETDLAIIDRAAHLCGLSLPDFVRGAAMRAAEEAVIESRPIRMSAEGFAAFVATLDASAKPVPEMVDLLRRPAPWPPDSAKS